MNDDLIKEGLEYFSNGNLQAAARSWLQVLASNPSDGQTLGYLKHIESLNPYALNRARREIENEPLAFVKNEVPVAGEPNAVPLAPAAITAAPEVIPPSPGAFVSAPAVQSPPAASLTPDPLSHPPKSGNEQWVVGQQETSSPDAPPPPAPEPLAFADNDPWGGAGTLGPPLQAVAEPAGLEVISPVADEPPAEEPGQSIAELEQQLQQLLELDDYSSAIETCEKIFLIDPVNSSAKAAKKQSRTMLERMLTSHFGGIDGVPELLITTEELIWQDLDHKAGFILAQVDGMATYSDILDVTGMDRIAALQIISGLFKKNIIGTAQ
ncbi:hypothetical protein KAI87_05115 [Myxococcota bacterium]|nr:hypothetical protein [Myxococcota bacterium]